MTFRPGPRIIATVPRRLDRPLPSIVSMARNASRAVLRAGLAAVTTGGVRVDETEQARRLDVCRACEWFRADERCAHPRCGCWIKAKTWLRSERCPAGRW